MARHLSVALLTLASLGPSLAHAQYVDLTTPDPIASELTDVRLSLHTERREAGIALLAGGLLSVIGGGVVAGVGHADPFWLAFGVGTAGWGAVNAGLSIALLDLGDAGFAAIEADRGLRGEELARAREAALRRQHDAATLFAVNTGLDVLYVAAGALLLLLADSLEGAEEQQMLRGYAVSQIAQGSFLLAFDLVEWIGSAQRADRVADVELPRW